MTNGAPDAAPADATTYRPGTRATWMLRVIILMWVLAPIALVVAEPHDGSGKRWLFVLPGALFAWLMALISYAGARRMDRSAITMGPRSFTYSLAPNTFWRNPLGMNTGTIAYETIKGVEIRRERLKAKGIRATYASVHLVRDGVPPETFARSTVGDQHWVQAFADDVAARAKVALVDRGEINAQYHGLNHPW